MGGKILEFNSEKMMRNVSEGKSLLMALKASIVIN